jgi:hypothetical protein
MKITNINNAGVFDENNAYHEGWEMVLTFTEDEISVLLSRYDSQSGTSPSVSDARPVLRDILDAVILKR